MPKQINFDNHSNGRFETAGDCPLCGEVMERELARGDLLVSRCSVCGHKEQRVDLMQHSRDSSRDGLSPESFLGIGGDSLRRLLPLLLILFLSACQGPLHEKRIQELERATLQLSREVITLRLKGRIEHKPRMQKLREPKASDQLFVVYIPPKETE